LAAVTYSRDGQIASIRIEAGPGNRFDPALRRELNACLQRYKEDEEAWVAVIAGAGPDFCLGCSDEAPRTYAEKRERFAMWAGGYVEVWKPTIAALQGGCRGEGLALALGCDLRVAEPSALLAADFTGTPHEPDVTGTLLLTLVGIAKTFELLWLGRELSAAEAVACGLVNRTVVKGTPEAAAAGEGRLPMLPMQTTITVEDGTAVTGAMALARELLLYAPVTRVFQKETALRSIGVPFQFAQSLEVGPNPYASEDRIEGGRAFVENRRPVWRNR
jgi:enoyl-CoA hydratase/carnithine racemase